MLSPHSFPLDVPRAGTALRHSEPQNDILESHASLFKACVLSSIRGHTEVPCLKHELSVNRAVWTVSS